MKDDEYNMDKVVEHTNGLAEDNNISFAEASTSMAEHLDGVKAKDILEHN